MTPPARSRSRPYSATIGLVFGGLWSALGAQALPGFWQRPAMLAGAAISLALIVRLWRSPGLTGGGTALFGRRAYLIAVVLEVLAIVAASNLLPRYGLQADLIEAVGVIVGLHFIGLWYATGISRFLWVAAGMCVASTAALLLPAVLDGIELRLAATGFGNALVLWIGAASVAKSPL